MITGQVILKNRDVLQKYNAVFPMSNRKYNHAVSVATILWPFGADKDTEAYWYNLLYPYAQQGLSLSQVKKKVDYPSAKVRKNAYDSAWNRAVKEVAQTKADLNAAITATGNAATAGLGIFFGNDGTAYSTKDGSVLVRPDDYVEPPTFWQENMIYILIAVALFLVFLIFKKRKRS